MKESAKSYVQKRIKQAQLPETNHYANKVIEAWGETKAIEVTRSAAQEDDTAITARLVELAETLPVSQKGEILSEAYAKSAENTMSFVKQYNDPILEEAYQEGVQRVMRISQGLRRAAQRSQNS